MKTGLKSTHAPRHGTLAKPGLVVALRREEGAPVLGRETVTSNDLADAVSETWRDCCLRAGRLDLVQVDLSVRVVPRPSTTNPDRLTGFELEPALGDDAIGGCSTFSIHALQEVAQRGRSGLVRSGVLEADEFIHYELQTQPVETVDPSRHPAPSDEDMFDLTERKPPLHFRSVPLSTLLAQAEEEPGREHSVFPVFYTREALALAEEFSRRGSPNNPAHESGGVLVGSLCTCPETGEFFVVVSEVFEVTDAEASLVSLEYSGRSWTRITAVVKARQQVDPAVRIVGQAHGHNFLPNDGQTCAECPRQDVCSTSNLFASPDDRTWTRAVFAHQPWALCHIFGLTARGDRVQGLFSQHDARLQQRDYHTLPAFEAERYPIRTLTV